jgi:hypothetical protein
MVLYALCDVFCVFLLRQKSSDMILGDKPLILMWFYHSWYYSLIGVKLTLKHLKLTTTLTVRNA